MANNATTLPGAPTRRSMHRGLRRREAFHAYVFMAPAILGLLLFMVGPIIVSLYLSFTDYNLLRDPRWVGLENYSDLLQEELFWKSLRVSATYSIIAVPLGLTIALVTAVLLDQKIRGIAFFRSMFYLPTVISGVGVAMLWRWMFNAEFGIINVLLSYIGIQGPNWITSEEWALPSLIAASCWAVGGTMLIFLAGLQGIPSELYEASEIDGAGRWGRFRRITLPLISNVTFFNLVLGIIGSLQTFTDAYVMTAGGPNNATLFVAIHLYRNAFQFLKMGYASAIAWVLFLIVLVLTALVFKSSPLWVYYENEQRGNAQ